MKLRRDVCTVVVPAEMGGGRRGECERLVEFRGGEKRKIEKKRLM